MLSLRTPLFWDLHLHGVAGIDFMKADLDAMAHVCEVLGKHGVGFFAPTLLTAKTVELRSACKAWGAFIEKSEQARYLSKAAARPLGLHLEGPWLSPKLPGAHPRESIKQPNLALAANLIAEAQGHISIVTMAPELPGALELSRRLSRANIRIQMGHTTATASEAIAATKWGFAGATHFYNAMRVHHRDSGPLAPLSRRLISAEIITDGVHLSADFVRWCLSAAGRQVYAVSDGCAATIAPRGTRLTLGPVNLRRQGRVAMVAKTETLAGGATLLTDHPSLLASALGRDYAAKHISIFYRLQSSFFGSFQGRPRRYNIFDARTLRHLGTE